jgi:GNAT superfamily N-acetyltransferase
VPVVREATSADVAGLSAALARAFDDDPVTRWIFPSARYGERLQGFFTLNLTKLALRHRLVFTTEDHRGGAIWMPPGAWELSLRDIVRTAPAHLRVLGRKVPSALRTLLQIEKRHPRAPHYYLATLGTDPAFQGTGVGTALLQPVLERCDTEGLPAYLESSKERNLAFYGRHGFEVTEELQLRGGGPPLWLMWREPRT